jgi:hypothetical protein
VLLSESVGGYRASVGQAQKPWRDTTSWTDRARASMQM